MTAEPPPRPSASTAPWLILAAAGALVSLVSLARLAASRDPPPVRPAPPVAGSVSLNTATDEELLGVPGMTPRLARGILGHREAHGPFRRVEEIDQVPGIGPKTLEKLKPYLQDSTENDEK